MQTLWKYLKPQWRLALLALLLAAISQVLALVDPIIFGKLIDEVATQRGSRPNDELVRTALLLLALAVGVALASRAARALQDYTVRRVVQRFGTQIFNDGLRQTMRLNFQEYEDARSGETLALLMRVRQDTERFINAFINVLFASLIGMSFLLWYAVTKTWLLVPVFLIGLVVLGGLSGLLSRQIRGQQRSINRETTKNAGFITESLRNVALIKSLGLTFREVRRMQAKTEEIFELEMAKVRRIRWLSFLQGSTLSLLKLSADLPRRADHGRADRHAVHLGRHPGAAAGAGHHHPGLARGLFVAGQLRGADGQAGGKAPARRGAAGADRVAALSGRGVPPPRRQRKLDRRRELFGAAR